MKVSENRFSQFRFAPHSESIPLNKIDTIDIDGIIARRDLEALTSNFDIIINTDVSAFKETDSWDTFIKLFRLAQLGLEFLLHCKIFLENSLDSTEAELEQIKKELHDSNSKKEVCFPEGKNRIVFKAKIRKPQFKCHLCHKIFINSVYLQHHGARRHSIKDSFKEHEIQPQNVKLPSNTSDKHHTVKKEGPQKEVKEQLHKNGKVSSENSVLQKPAARLLHLLSNLEYDDFIGQKCQLKNSTPLNTSPIDFNDISNGDSIESELDEKEGKINVSEIVLSRTEKAGKSQFLKQEVRRSRVKFVEPTTNQISNVENRKTEPGNRKLSCIEENVKGRPKSVCRSKYVASTAVEPQAKEAQSGPSLPSHSVCIHGSKNVDQRNETINDDYQKALPQDYMRFKQCIVHRINIVQDPAFIPESHKDDISPIMEEYLEKPVTDGLPDRCCSERRFSFELEDVNNRMKELGIDPQWKGIPDAVAKKYLATLNLQRRKKAKVFKNYFHIRNTIINQMKKKLKEKLSESSLISDPLEEDEYV